MDQTKLNQNQINLGSETAIDLLAMQNGWKSSLIGGLNNSIMGYASETDTWDQLISKFANLTATSTTTIQDRITGSSQCVFLCNKPLVNASGDAWSLSFSTTMDADGDKTMIQWFVADSSGPSRVYEHPGLFFSFNSSMIVMYISKEDSYNTGSSSITWNDPDTEAFLNAVNGTNQGFSVTLSYSADGKYSVSVSAADGHSLTTEAKAGDPLYCSGAVKTYAGIYIQHASASRGFNVLNLGSIVLSRTSGGTTTTFTGSSSVFHDGDTGNTPELITEYGLVSDSGTRFLSDYIYPKV